MKKLKYCAKHNFGAPLNSFFADTFKSFHYNTNIVICSINLLSSAWLAMSNWFTTTKRSQSNILNKIGPITDPRGTSKRSCSHEIKDSLILVYWFLWSSWLFISFKVFRLNPYAFIFVLLTHVTDSQIL